MRQSCDDWPSRFGLELTAWERRRSERNEISEAAQPERRRQLKTEAPPIAASGGMPIVTSARIAQWNRRGREGDRADRQPVERSEARVGHGGGEL